MLHDLSKASSLMNWCSNELVVYFLKFLLNALIVKLLSILQLLKLLSCLHLVIHPVLISHTSVVAWSIWSKNNQNRARVFFIWVRWTAAKCMMKNNRNTIVGLACCNCLYLRDIVNLYQLHLFLSLFANAISHSHLQCFCRPCNIHLQLLYIFNLHIGYSCSGTVFHSVIALYRCLC